MRQIESTGTEDGEHEMGKSRRKRVGAAPEGCTYRKTRKRRQKRAKAGDHTERLKKARSLRVEHEVHVPKQAVQQVIEGRGNPGGGREWP